jgi:uncharacterized membrane protein
VNSLRQPLHLTRLTLFLAVVVLLGIGFRLINLDGKLYWHDEAYTSLRVSGYTQAEVRQQVFNGEVIEVAALEKYQRLNLDRGAGNTLKVMIVDDAQHPPLYYVLVRYWVLAFGNSIAAIRSFSVLAGLLMLPAIYCLCQEWFASPTVSFMAVALVAISPFHILYAQEAREYALWTLLIILSSWALLRALRVKTAWSWVVYAVMLLLSFYTYLFTGLVAIGHGAYVIARRSSRNTIAYLLASGVAVICFLPWLWIVIATWSTNGATWTAVPIPLLIWLKLWGMSLERAFVLTIGDFGFDTKLVYFTLPWLLILVIYALYRLCRETPVQTWWFVLTLIGSTALPLALPDLILGGQRSTSSRYLVPCYLGIQLAVAYLFASHLNQGRAGQRHLWRGIVAIVFSLGVVSGVITAQADTSWNKVVSYNNRAIAHLVNQAEQPLLVTSSFGINFGNILALSHLLDRKVKLQLIEGSTSPDFENIPTVPSGSHSVFLLNLTDQGRRAIEQQHETTAQPIFSDHHLFLSQLR